MSLLVRFSRLETVRACGFDLGFVRFFVEPDAAELSAEQLPSLVYVALCDLVQGVLQLSQAKRATFTFVPAGARPLLEFRRQNLQLDIDAGAGASYSIPFELFVHAVHQGINDFFATPSNEIAADDAVYADVQMARKHIAQLNRDRGKFYLPA